MWTLCVGWRHECGLYGLGGGINVDSMGWVKICTSQIVLIFIWYRGYQKYYCSVRDCFLRMENKPILQSC